MHASECLLLSVVCMSRISCHWILGMKMYVQLNEFITDTSRCRYQAIKHWPHIHDCILSQCHLFQN